MKVSKLARVTAPVRGLVDWLPLVHWGRSLFGPPDDADGSIVNGMLLRRGPDGRLYAVQIPPKQEKKK